MKRPVPRRRSKRSHRAILDAAARILQERGYADVTIDGIAARARVGKTTIYRWWPNKASIFMELYAELASKLALTPPPDSGDVVTDLGLLLKGTFKLYRESAAALALSGIVAEAQSNATVSRMVRNDFAPSRRQIVANLLARGVERGEIPKHIDVDLVSELVAGATWYYVLVGTSPLTDRQAIRLSEQIMFGVIPRTDLGTRRRAAAKTVRRNSARVAQNA
jgi:AcrR family transcriptional regulator